MFLEGQINWVWVLGGLAAAGWVIGLIGLWLAAANRSRHVDTSGQLDLVQRVAEDCEQLLGPGIELGELHLDANGDVVLKVFRNDLDAHALGTPGPSAPEVVAEERRPRPSIVPTISVPHKPLAQE